MESDDLITVVADSGAEDEEGTAASEGDILPRVVEFLDHFDVALDVVVSCARKTEVTRWPRLFEAVGKPRFLFEASPWADHRGIWIIFPDPPIFFYF